MNIGDILHDFDTGELIPLNDAYGWIASFCRDSTPNFSLSYATYEFIKNRLKRFNLMQNE